ncbi:hypothetical protein [Microtetraspora malaysiensis]|uniref:hypothetical protein n=1 Tax=Microtetraspora malaysiensis TaxID=161358 RepID=UPI003D93EFB4
MANDDEVALALAAAYAHGPGKSPVPGAAVHREPARAEEGVRTPLHGLSAWGEFGAALARLLVSALTPQRWEPYNPYNDHRAYPSPRAAFLVDVLVRTERGRWRLDPVRRELVGESRPEPAGTVWLDLLRRPERLRPGYGELADALAELETGHLAGAVADHAAGLPLTVASGPAGITLTPGMPARPGHVSAGGARRSAGLGPRGLSADPRPLPGEAARAFAAAVADPPPGSPAADGGVWCRLAVRNVMGLADGWYVPAPLTAATERAGAAMSAVQAAYSYPRTQFDVGGSNLGLLIAGDVGSAVRASGQDGYRALLRAAGALAQHACSAGAASGLFCRPVRAMREGLLEAAAGAPASYDALYLVLAGRPRFTWFDYDLSPH